MTEDSDAVGRISASTAGIATAGLPETNVATVVAASSGAPSRAYASGSPSTEAVDAAVKQLETHLRARDRELEFRVDAGTGMTIVSIRDRLTGEVIRQIPSEEIVRLAETLTTRALGGGALLDVKV